MKVRTRTIERLRDALLQSGRKPSAVLSSAYETLARQGLLTDAEKAAVQRVDSVAETMFLMMAADGQVTEGELAAMRGAIRGLTGESLGDGIIKVMIEGYAIRLQQEGREQRLRAIAGSLRQQTDEAASAFALAAAVALADNDFAESENTFIHELAGWFGFDEARANAILDEL
ncbi:MAG TPA: TerB family tellurite resistance protein, partial [Polyangiaceae bacterium]|nr:TerB family tellurite resistance protein [Polyangiaceae bacterium]